MSLSMTGTHKIAPNQKCQESKEVIISKNIGRPLEKNSW
jgi:hypothetical protein